MILEYPRSVMVLGLKGQRSRLELKCLLANIHVVTTNSVGYPRCDIVLGLKGQRSRLGVGLGLGYRNTAWVRTLWVLSSSCRKVRILVCWAKPALAPSFFSLKPDLSYIF